MKLFTRMLAAVAAVCAFSSPVLASGEMFHGGSYDWADIPRGTILDEDVDNEWEEMHQARWVAERILNGELGMTAGIAAKSSCRSFSLFSVNTRSTVSCGGRTIRPATAASVVS